ncbi:MAG: TauD/TfdA family dioxygenase [Nocardia sp.]|nr:TauD/TfdA family dioxygenase [Nocardia sp.]
MKSVLHERKPADHEDNSTLERRRLPVDAAAAVLTIADEIALTVQCARSETEPVPRELADPRLIEAIDERVAQLPDSVHTALRPPATAAGAAVIDSLPILGSDLGPTPRDWRVAARDSTAASYRLDIAMLLLARCAGEPFGWAGQQHGRPVNNILPTPGHEDEQSGASSTTLLSPHTEDAFHPERAHLLLLGCLRNPDRVGTTISSVRQVRLRPDQRRLLARATLPILPDVSYGEDFAGYRPAPVATLAAGPVLRYDPAYTPLDDADAEYRRAYAELGAELTRVCRCAILDPGELLLVDNDVVVHGRVPFTARYDGTDRWLKRVNIRLGRGRPVAEAAENGYGQCTSRPFAMKPAAAHHFSHRSTAPRSEDSSEQPPHPASRPEPQRSGRCADRTARCGARGGGRLSCPRGG